MIIKNPRTLIPALIAALLMVAVAVGCTFTGAKSGTDEPSPLETKIEVGLNDPDPLVRQAWSMIRGDIEQNEETSRQIFADEGTRFTDAEITALELIDSFDSIHEDAVIEVYLLQYRMLPEDMTKIVFAGGMKARDGWLLSGGSMGSPHLVAEDVDEEITYIGTIHPEGEGQGVLDATLELLYRLGSQDAGSVATSPIEISRVYAVTNPDLTPREAAELLTLCFVESLRENDDLENPTYKTFVLTDYKDLSFEMYPTTGAPDEYQLHSWEVSEQSWIIEPSVAYQYIGTISPFGDGRSIPADQWITELYQGSRIGFLMTKDGDSYTFRSRYFTQGQR